MCCSCLLLGSVSGSSRTILRSCDRKNCWSRLPLLFLGTIVYNETEPANRVQFVENVPGSRIEDRQVEFEICFSEQGARDVCFRGHLLDVSTMDRHPYRILSWSSSRSLAHNSDNSKCCLYSLLQPASRRPSPCSNGQKLGRIAFTIHSEADC